MAPPYVFRCSLEDDSIQVKLASADEQDSGCNLMIRFMRTIRVPDNAGEVELPLDPGPFSLFSVRRFASKLPREMAAKAGVFFPMYQREAMWIDFRADRKFMVKVYVGGVNAVSGEHRIETPETKTRRMGLLSKWKNIQDYIVIPSQPWLGGYATSPDVIKQFVAMPLKTGYSVEAQLTRQEVASRLQLEITPYLPEVYPIPVKVYPLCVPSENFLIYIHRLSGKTIHLRCSPTDTIGSVKGSIQNMEGIPQEFQRLIFSPRDLDDPEQTLDELGVKNNDHVHLVLNIRCAACGHQGPRTITADGTVRQQINYDVTPDSWAKATTMTIPVHILTTELFHQVTGQSAPPCPISASTYMDAGLPVFDFPEEPSPTDILLRGGKRVSRSDSERRRVTDRRGSTARSMVLALRPRAGEQAAQASVDQVTIEDPDGLVNPDGPYRAVRTLKALRNEVRRDDESERNV
ncbi:hypothetical protein F4859DRAFT_527147 [Xylaria cf. heliscus]|nr:hypothetical protein F4859DRAFT_527147 [Xylaria cf. heliscus]